MPDIKTLAAARNVDLVNTFTKSLDKLAAMLSTCTPIQAAVGETLHQKKITGKLSEAEYTEGSDSPCPPTPTRTSRPTRSPSSRTASRPRSRR